ncbi:acyl-CoA dehydrogenase family protein [Nocardia fusca]|uniref:acyl-CoA dehydrogenase family protein n=1 Tax=Nocardia fusca TaxID=941183 RepID=UPI0007A74E92|nr:acyl-CoA dehydrogenase family protein [Nocardia fusca]
MDLIHDEEHERFRTEVRNWLDANKPPLPMPHGESPEGIDEHKRWERLLFEAGFAAVTWPREYGGRELDLWHWLIFEEEFFRAGLPQRLSTNGMSLLAPALIEYGTSDQKDRYLRRMASLEDMWCQGWSEPEAGSDLASLRSVARRDDEAAGWRLHGRKTWSTRGVFANRLFGLFRTGDADGRHRGLTYFLVDLDQPGVTVSAVGKMDGQPGFSEITFDGAFVSDADVLGGVGAGWQVAMMTAGNERSLSLRSPGRFTAAAERLVGLHHEAPEWIRQDRTIQQRVVDVWMRAREYALSTDMAVTGILQGHKIGAESSLSKVFWSELDIELHETAMVILDGRADRESRWTEDYQFSLAGPIYAGTNEIQRTIIAERVLGLPRK